MFVHFLNAYMRTFKIPDVRGTGIGDCFASEKLFDIFNRIFTSTYLDHPRVDNPYQNSPLVGGGDRAPPNLPVIYAYTMI